MAPKNKESAEETQERERLAINTAGLEKIDSLFKPKIEAATIADDFKKTFPLTQARLVSKAWQLLASTGSEIDIRELSLRQAQSEVLKIVRAGEEQIAGGKQGFVVMLEIQAALWILNTMVGLDSALKKACRPQRTDDLVLATARVATWAYAAGALDNETDMMMNGTLTKRVLHKRLGTGGKGGGEESGKTRRDIAETTWMRRARVLAGEIRTQIPHSTIPQLVGLIQDRWRLRIPVPGDTTLRNYIRHLEKTGALPKKRSKATPDKRGNEGPSMR